MNTKIALENVNCDHNDGWVKELADEQLRNDAKRILPAINFKDTIIDVLDKYNNANLSSSEAKNKIANEIINQI